MPVKLLAFPSAYFFESGLFKGLRVKKIKFFRPCLRLYAKCLKRGSHTSLLLARASGGVDGRRSEFQQLEDISMGSGISQSICSLKNFQKIKSRRTIGCALLYN